MSELKLYSCDACKKEHRRTTRVCVDYACDGSIKKYFNHLCDLCEREFKFAMERLSMNKVDWRGE